MEILNIPLWMLIALLSAITYSMREVLSKKILKKYDTSGTQINFEENLVIILAMLLIFFPFIQFDLFYEYIHLFLIKGTLLTVATLFFFSLLKQYEISMVSPMMNLSPFFLLILSSIFLSEQISYIQVLGIFIIIISTFLLEHINQTHHNSKLHSISEMIHHFKFHFKVKNWRFIVSIVIVLISLSFGTILDKTLFSSGISIVSNLYFTGLIIFLYMIIYLSYSKTLVKSCRNVIKQPQTLLIGVVGLIDRGLVFYAISIPSSLVSLIIPLRRTATIYSSIIGGILFHEKNLKKKLIITCLMIIGVALISL